MSGMVRVCIGHCVRFVLGVTGLKREGKESLVNGAGVESLGRAPNEAGLEELEARM